MTKYESTDDRTGIPVGHIRELTREEVDRLPFNVFLRSVEPVDESALLEAHKKEMLKEALRLELLDKGLSFNRTKLILDKYADKDELLKHAEHASIDTLTDDWVKKEYATNKIKKETKKVN